jgi:hypothetical protein
MVATEWWLPVTSSGESGQMSAFSIPEKGVVPVSINSQH